MQIKPNKEQKLAGKKIRKRKSLAEYAQFILTHHLDEFIEEAIRLSFEMDIPLMKYMKQMPEAEFRMLAKASNTDLLNHIAAEKPEEYIANRLCKWMADQLPLIERDQVVVEDISIICQLRKKLFLHFIARYTTDVPQILALVNEIDDFHLAQTSAFFKAFISLLEDRIHEHVALTEKANASFKQAQAITHIGNYTWDLTTNKLTWSDELYRIYGIDPKPADSFDSNLIRPYNHPEDADVVTQHITRAKETLKPFDFHYRIVLPDQTIKTLHARGEVVADDNGKAVQIIGTAQDVTERQNLIDRLQQSKKLYKQAQALAHMGNWEWDVNRNNVTWTDELYRIYGLTPQSEQITLESFLAKVHPDDRDRVIKETMNTLEKKTPTDFFHRIVLQDGSVKILHAKSEALVDPAGKVIGILGTAQDVSVEKELERKLTENQMFIQKVADAAPSIIATYNVNTGACIFVSEGLKKLLGYKPQDALGQRIDFFTSIIHPDDLERIKQQNIEALKEANTMATAPIQEPVVEFQYRMKHASGEYRWFQTFGTVFDRNHQRKVEHVLHISLDITERINAEQVLQQRTAELQQSNASLEEFAYVASHDLKEPLRKIITFSDRLLAKESPNVSHEGKEYLEKIMNSSIRMQQMVNDLLALSVISVDKVFIKTDMQKLLNDVMMTFEHKLEELQARVEVDDLPEVSVVPSQFRQLLQNIVSNSLKFAKQNIAPVITIKHDFLLPQDVSSYSIQQAESYFRIQISDNGIGFDNAYVDKIFAVFQRLHHRDIYEGTGIGLAICKKIVENHGGVIFASGVLQQGATFTIIIPQ